jgi:formate dehydrogenase subunit gamma
MGAPRIAGAIVGVIAAALFIWVIVVSFGPEDIVAPTVQVTTGANQQAGQPATVGQAGNNQPANATGGQPTASQILAARTELLRDRTETGPKAFPPLAAGDFTIKMSRKGAPNTQDPRQWKQNKPAAGMLKERGNIAGISSLPYKEAASFQQPGGRTWRRAHNDQVRYGGGWIIFGIVMVLAIFLAARGRIKVAEGFDGRTIVRFNGVERATHWMTGISFTVMGITGLIILYGKPGLILIFGEAAFGDIAFWSAWLHMSFAIAFTIGILVMLGMWIADNLPTRADWEWIKQGGGFLRDTAQHPPAYKFNAGQKLLFWTITLSSLALLGTGITLMFPFFWAGYDGMQWVQISHAAIALLLIGLIIAHIYIGTIGMQGAFDAMWSGNVDWNWAKEHHKLWFEKITGRRAETDATPAE